MSSCDLELKESPPTAGPLIGLPFPFDVYLLHALKLDINRTEDNRKKGAWRKGADGR